jgi:hypothetical protein
VTRLVRSRTFPLLAGHWSFGQFWGFWVLRAAMGVIVLATLGITATGLFARDDGPLHRVGRSDNVRRGLGQVTTRG